MALPDLDLALPTQHKTLHKTVVKSLALKLIEADENGKRFSLPPELEACEQMNVSRSSLREAVKVLAAKGMLELRPKTGTRARPRDEWNLLDPDLLAWQCERSPSARLLTDLYELRVAVEPTAAELAALRATPAEVEQLKTFLTAMEEAVMSPQRFAEPDVAFHMAIYKASRNQLIEQLSGVVRQAFANALKETTLPDALSKAMPSHRKLFKAIASGKAAAARKAALEVVEFARWQIRKIAAEGANGRGR